MVVGSIIYAVGVNGFTAPNNIAPGRRDQASRRCSTTCSTHRSGIVIFLINIPIILWAIVEIGYKLVAKTMLAIICNSVAIDVVALFMPVYTRRPADHHADRRRLRGRRAFARLYARRSTTGGTDMIARLLNHRLRHLSMGKLMLAVDGCVVLLSAFVFQSIESAVYACVVIFVSTKLIDTILYGTDAGNGKMFFILSKKNEEIAERILNDLDRGRHVPEVARRIPEAGGRAALLRGAPFRGIPHQRDHPRNRPRCVHHRRRCGRDRRRGLQADALRRPHARGDPAFPAEKARCGGRCATGGKGKSRRRMTVCFFGFWLSGSSGCSVPSCSCRCCWRNSDCCPCLVEFRLEP